MDQREWNIKINLFQQITSPFFCSKSHISHTRTSDEGTCVDVDMTFALLKCLQTKLYLVYLKLLLHTSWKQSCKSLSSCLFE